MNPDVKTFLLFLTVGLLALPVALRAQREKLPPADLEFVEKNWPEAKKTTNGIRYIIIREGKDDSPKTGDRVFVLYVGRLLDGNIFDQNEDRAHPFEFRIRRDMVIQGWDQVLQLMKRGEKRLAIIPPNSPTAPAASRQRFRATPRWCSKSSSSISGKTSPVWPAPQDGDSRGMSPERRCRSRLSTV